MPVRGWVFVVGAAALAACGDDAGGQESSTGQAASSSGAAEASDTGSTDGSSGAVATTSPETTGGSEACEGYPVLHDFEPARAERGEALLRSGLGAPLVPRLALENLWLVWGGGAPADYWAAFRERYGLVEATWENDDYPVGIHATGPGMATLDCLFCHADVVAGELMVGAGNSRVDFQGFYDDLVALNEIAPDFGFPQFEVPWDIEGRTAAAGATDAYGLGMELSLPYGPPDASMATRYGFQQPAAWWTVRHKDRVYSDGSGDAQGHRTMAAMTLAFGASFSDTQSLDEDMRDIHHYIRSLQAPPWSASEIDESAAQRGRAVFDATCARCHGSPCGGAPAYASPVTPLGEIGTDAARSKSFTTTEAAWINGSWYGEAHPVQDTDGYLAPPLAGVWATAPYFHNGSVPDVRGVLDSSQRPIRWRRTGTGEDDYDTQALGWRFEVVDEPVGQEDIEARRVYDTTAPGLDNGGHTFGDGLSDGERVDLLEFLKTL